jgi:hypothetical protein
MNDRNDVWHFPPAWRLCVVCVVRNLIVERWQTIFSDPSTLRYHNHFGTLCTLLSICRLSISVSIVQLNYKFDIRHLSLITLSFCFLHIFQNVNYGVLKQKKKSFQDHPVWYISYSSHFVYCFIALVRIRVDIFIVMSYFIIDIKHTTII